MHKDAPVDPQEHRLHQLESELAEIKGELKERETSVFRAMKTLLQDFRRYQTGEIEEFPREALLGLTFAYLRPRIVIAIASLSAVALGGLQLLLLYQQNQTMRSQTQILEEQSRLVRSQVAADVVSAIADVQTNYKPDAPEITIAQLLPLASGDGFESVASIAVGQSNDGLAAAALRALAASVDRQVPDQQVRVLSLLFQSIEHQTTEHFSPISPRRPHQVNKQIADQLPAVPNRLLQELSLLVGFAGKMKLDREHLDAFFSENDASILILMPLYDGLVRKLTDLGTNQRALYGAYTGMVDVVWSHCAQWATNSTPGTFLTKRLRPSSPSAGYPNPMSMI